MKQCRGAEYIEYSTPSSLSGWGNFWFYAKNLSPSLPEHQEGAPVPSKSWNGEVDDEDMAQIQDLLKKIKGHRQAGVTGATVVWSWLQRRIQPLQRRANFGYHYGGEEDPSRMSRMAMFEATALKYLKKAVGVTAIPVIPELFSADNAPLPVSCFSRSSCCLNYLMYHLKPFFSVVE